jgi:hypothetical protein
MPLKKGRSDKVVGANISEIMRSYEKTGKIGESKPTSKKKAVKQAAAISLSEAGKSRKMASGGAVRTVKKRDGNNPVKIY